MVLGNPVDDCHKFLNLLVGNGNLHALAPQHIRRAHQHRIPQAVGHGLRLLRRVHRTACCPGNACLFQYFIKKLPVLSSVHILRFGA